MSAEADNISGVTAAGPEVRTFALTKPNGPKLSAYTAEITAIEESHWLTNYGPTNRRLETKIIEDVFDGRGHCLTVCNATIGLMIALKFAVDERAKRGARFVIMPSFTFAAAAHAVLWAGLTPLLVDIDPQDWAASRVEEEVLLRKYGSRVAAIMPYATFGSCIDLARYDRLSDQYGVPVVVDAAASLGSIDSSGRAFGYGSKHTIVYSMHATKAFGVGECGLIYSEDELKVDALRRMGNFGFDAQRSAISAGLNSKISEVVALSALIKLSDYRTQILHRAELAQLYFSELPNWRRQLTHGQLVAYQFLPILLPKDMKESRMHLTEALARKGVGTGQYFSPHIGQQPYFRGRCLAGDLSVTEDVSAAIVSLPMSDFMSVDDVIQICAEIRSVENELTGRMIVEASLSC